MDQNQFYYSDTIIRNLIPFSVIILVSLIILSMYAEELTQREFIDPASPQGISLAGLTRASLAEMAEPGYYVVRNGEIYRLNAGILPDNLREEIPDISQFTGYQEFDESSIIRLDIDSRGRSVAYAIWPDSMSENHLQIISYNYRGNILHSMSITNFLAGGNGTGAMWGLPSVFISAPDLYTYVNGGSIAELEDGVRVFIKNPTTYPELHIVLPNFPDIPESLDIQRIIDAYDFDISLEDEILTRIHDAISYGTLEKWGDNPIPENVIDNAIN